MTTRLAIGAVCILFVGCGEAPGDGSLEADETPDAISAELGESACTTVPAPPLGTTGVSIGNFEYNPSNCHPIEEFWSPSYMYNPSGCPRQYILELHDSQKGPIESPYHPRFRVGWGGPELTSTTCPQAHLAMTVWKFVEPGFWELQPDQIRATGVWVPDVCMFVRDDNGSSDMSVGIETTSHMNKVRIAVQARRNKNYHSVAVRNIFYCE
jgi:hypothetical protein